MIMSEISDEQRHIRSILDGNTSAFTHIINAHQNKIRAFINKRCSNSADSDDITQEIFIAVHKNLHQYKSEFPFSAWIFGIARNKANEHFRKAKRLPIPSEHTEDVGHSDNPQSRIFIAEKSNQFWNEAKRVLSEEQFIAIWLKYQQDLQVTDICEHMQITQSNVKIHLFRARKKLAQSKLINNLTL
ncbi:MAG: RNA polymerase sigma-70 factor (ECF subfamily) [Rubritalea sp.]|jgi:RNA polymerase sigma-70 factor (ECF subfamily)